jgi:O-antigen ligase
MRAPYQGCVPAIGGQIPVVGLGIHYDALRSTFFGGQRRRSLGAVRSSPLDTRRDSMLYRTVPKPPAWPPPARPGDIAATFDYARESDPIGNGVHVPLAILYVGCLAMRTAPKEIALLLLLVYSLMRLHCTWRCYTCMLRDPIGWCLLGWIAWHALSLLWTPHLEWGVNEIRTTRFVGSILVLWPVLRYQRLLVGGLLTGIFLMNVIQVMQRYGIAGFELDENNRADGLIHPIHAGSLCSCAVIWHAVGVIHPCVPRYRALVRAVSLALLALALICLALTGSRGPMVALAPALLLLVLHLIWGGRRWGRTALVTAAASLIGAAIVWSIAGSVITDRWNDALSDIDRYRHADYESDVGMRLALWNAGWEAFQAAPIQGVGAGGLAGALETETYGPSSDAHSMYVHELATGGLIGFGLLATVLTATLIRAWRADRTRLWATGTPFVLLALLGAAMFDTYQLNGHMLALITLLIAITHPYVQPAGDPANGIE